MPDVSQMTDSKFLKQADVGSGKLLTITECVQRNVAKDNEKPEMKWCLFFEEEEKGMVLNTANAQLIAAFTGERNSDNWGGIKIVAYVDPSIMFGGKITGGIRCRAPRGKAAQTPPIAKPAPAQLDADEDLDEIPF